MTVRVWAGILASAGLWAQTAPDRVGRVSFLYGAVSYRPAQTQDWGDATLNLPLSNGDHLWTDLNAQAEVRIDALAVHLAPQTAISVVAIDDRSFRLSLTEGAINLRVSRMNEGDVVEVATPGGTIRLLTPGSYRFDAVAGYTSIAVRSGAAQAVSGPQSVRVDAGQRLILAGAPAVLEFLDLPPLDAWDEWCAERDAAAERDLEASEAYVSWEIPGVEDLAPNGDWVTDGEAGVCWEPRYVSADWMPFQHGHWIYKAPWGWTWVDDAAWGFAPSHYGRWTKIKDGWAWLPGRHHIKEPYSPATVAFATTGGRVAWAALGPGALANRDGAASADLTAFRTARPVGSGRMGDSALDFASRQPAVEPTPEALVGGFVHRAKPEVEARIVAPPAPAIPLPVTKRTGPLEDHRSDPTPAPAPSPAVVEEPHHSSAATHSEAPRQSEPDPPHHDPDPPHHSDPPHSAPAPPPPPPQHTESHPAVQEHRVEASHTTPPSSRSDTSGSSGSHRK